MNYMTTMTSMLESGKGWMEFIPGLFAVVVIALAATFVSEHYGGPAFLCALFLGICLNLLETRPTTQPGVEFAAQTVLGVAEATFLATLALSAFVVLRR